MNKDMNRYGEKTGMTPEEFAEMRAQTRRTLSTQKDLADSLDSVNTEDLIRMLKTGDEKARSEAALSLQTHRCDASVKVNAFTEALKDSSDEVVWYAAQGLRIIAARGEYRIDPEPLLETLRNQPKLANPCLELKYCLRLLGLQHEVDKIT